MVATNYLSQHSSNPMEVRLADCVSYSSSSSDDPLMGFPDPQMEAYKTHIAQVIKEYRKPDREELVDLDDSDELQAFDQDDTPRKARYEDEEMGYEPESDEYQDLDDVQPIFDDEDDRVLRNGGRTDGDEEMDLDWQGDEDEPDDVQRTSDDVDCFVLDESEEASSIRSKPQEEQAEIRQEIQDFKSAVPHLAEDYKLIDRLGTGTFSSVYKAIDLRYDEWDNTPWQGHHPPESSAHYQSVPHPQRSRVFVAIKRIYVTSGPDRIRNELLLMESCRGCRHVSQVITAFRHEDQVAIVMPYHRNADFREFFQELPMAGIKEYFRSLMRALRDIHRRGIIHRDIKPANFLFDPRTGQGSLCDFGLAQSFDNRIPTHGSCLHTNVTDESPHGKYVSKNEYSIEAVKKQQADARWKSKQRGDAVGYPDKDSRVPMKANRAGTRGFRAPEVLLKCGQQCGAVDVWSAGVILLFFLTHKFPLFQANDDVEALMEIAAIFGKVKMEKVATLHCRTFASNVPDIPNEQVTWRQFTERLNPGLHKTPPPNLRFYPYTLPSYGLKLQAEADKDGLHSSMAIDVASSNPLLTSPTSEPPTNVDSESKISTTGPSTLTSTSALTIPPTTASMESTYQKDVEDALSLLEQLLHPESVKRITPRGALYHPFLFEKQQQQQHAPGAAASLGGGSGKHTKKGDDDFEPHPFGHGVCKELHFVDAVTDQPGVIIRVKKCVCGCGGQCGGDGEEEVRKLVSAGEGIAIGNEPCEFHRNIVWPQV